MRAVQQGAAVSLRAVGSPEPEARLPPSSKIATGDRLTWPLRCDRPRRNCRKRGRKFSRRSSCRASARGEGSKRISRAAADRNLSRRSNVLVVHGSKRQKTAALQKLAHVRAGLPIREASWSAPALWRFRTRQSSSLRRHARSEPDWRCVRSSDLNHSSGLVLALFDVFGGQESYLK